jgi:hypothetical protein
MPEIAPKSARTTNTQSVTLEGSVKTADGVETSMVKASVYKNKELRLDSSITLFFGYRSTRDPRKKPDRATVGGKHTRHDRRGNHRFCLEKYPKVTANHTKLLMTEAASEFARMV